MGVVPFQGKYEKASLLLENARACMKSTGLPYKASKLILNYYALASLTGFIFLADKSYLMTCACM